MAEPLRPLKELDWILAPIAILLVGVLLCLIHGSFYFPPIFVEKGRGVVPGSFQVSLDRVGSYELALYTAGRLDGKKYHSPPELPEGLEILVKEPSYQQALSIERLRPKERVLESGERKIAIFSFRAPVANVDYRIESVGISEPLLIGVRVRPFVPVLWGVLAQLAIITPFAAAAVALFFFLLARQAKKSPSR